MLHLDYSHCYRMPAHKDPHSEFTCTIAYGRPMDWYDMVLHQIIPRSR